MLKRCSWLLSALFLLVLNATSAHAGAWPTTHPELCTPDGYSTPVMCTPIKTDDWQYFDFSGIPYNGSLPGYYPSEGTFLGAVSDYYTSHSFCDVQVSGVTGCKQ